MARVCITAREHHPYGGGIGVSVPALARLLAAEHDVVLITSSAEGDLPPAPAELQRVTVAGPADWRRAGFACEAHAWSAAVVRGIEEAYGDGPGPDLLEAPDYCGQAHVAIQAARSGHPLMAGCRIAVRLRGTAEISMLHNDWWPLDEDELSLYAMERAALAGADCLVWAGGATSEVYRSYYGEDRLAPSTQVRLPLPAFAPPGDRGPRHPSDPLRLVFAGRLERRKGVLELVEAVRSLPDAPVTLALAGDDSATGPHGVSMRAVLESMIAGDERISILGGRGRDDVVSAIHGADVVVVPSRFEWWSNVVQEAMAVGTPVVATPVGGYLEQIVPDVTGWLTDGVGSSAIAAVLGQLAGDRERVERLRAAGGGPRHVATLTDEAQILASYRALLARPARSSRRPAVGRIATSITAVVPTHDDADLALRAARSFLAESEPLGDVVVVDDGSGPASRTGLDSLRDEPCVQVIHRSCGGPSAARNTGLLFADGACVLLLDADDVLVPGFLERAVHALDSDPDVAFAVPWTDLEEGAGWCPLGAGHEWMTHRNVVGGSCVLVRRAVLDHPRVRFDELNLVNQDYELLATLLSVGHRGVVVPMHGVRGQRRPDGLSARFMSTYRPIALREMDARERARRVTWTTTG